VITTLATVTVAIVAALHIGFMILEMFWWTKPLGRRIFGLRPDYANTTSTLAANQGLYNGFLAAGLTWGLLAGANQVGLLTFFLTCVIVAGIYGAITVSRSILVVQAAPAAVALALVLLAR
jgi:putative membrane protein